MRRIGRISKLLLLCAMVLLGLGSASAQGIGSVGLSAGFASYNDGGYASVFLQCDIIKHVRIAPELGYMFRNDGKNGVEVSVDAQFPFQLGRIFTVYPLAGVTYNYWKHHPHGDSTNRVGIDIGAGFDVKLSSNLKLLCQGKGSLMDDTGGGFFCLGIGYLF